MDEQLELSPSVLMASKLCSTDSPVTILVPLQTVTGSKVRLSTLIGNLPFCDDTTALATSIGGFVGSRSSTSHVPVQSIFTFPIISISLTGAMVKVSSAVISETC